MFSEPLDVSIITLTQISLRICVLHLIFVFQPVFINQCRFLLKENRWYIKSLLLLHPFFSFCLFCSVLQDMITKEVIRPQVPLRPPCYDFSLVADPRFDSTN